MTEVVHILSTIAPIYGTKRRNVPMAAAFNLTTSPHVGRCDPAADDIERHQECSTSVQWQARCAPPSPPPGRASWPGDRGNGMNKGAGAGAVVSGELVNGMLLMSPHGRSSWQPPPDEELEAVDLTEPRLETFTQPAMFR
uniref:Uncharacterized protein n=1 Tax=Arundo donax TaxID=35708 RepID=A0A0A9D075_ARUDO